jgi:hypothetical protein
MSPLAIDWIPFVGGACVLFVVAITVALLAPGRARQDAIDHEIEARLLLGEDPDEIDRDLTQRAAQAAANNDITDTDAAIGGEPAT